MMCHILRRELCYACEHGQPVEHVIVAVSESSAFEDMEDLGGHDTDVECDDYSAW